MITTAHTQSLQSQPASPRGRWAAVAVIVLATLLGAGVRLHDLGGGVVWFDELYTLRDLTSDHKGRSPTRWLGYQPTRIGLLIQGIGSTDIPGERYWEYQQAGTDLDKARIGACVLGILTIPLLAWAAWRPLGPGAAAVLAVLLAFCVWNVAWSQFARFYTQVGLFGGLAVLWYLDAIKTGCRWRFAGSTVMVVLCYISHPPAILIGGALMLDALVQLVRRRPLNYGRWGWGWALGSMAVCVGIMLYEHYWERRYDFAAGSGSGAGAITSTSAEPLAQSAPMVLIYFCVMLTPVLVAAAIIGWSVGRRHREVWVLGFAAVVPLSLMTAIALAGGYAHARYAYVSMAGWLGLSAVGLAVIAQAMRPRLGAVLSWSPAALVLVAMMPTLGSYLTTGHHFAEPFHLGWAEVNQRIEPGDVVFAERYEVAQYYLQREEVMELPGVINAMDEQAAGRVAWIVRLSANSRGRRDWKPAHDPRMQLIARDASAVWLPHREVSVYRLTPPSASAEPGPDTGGLDEE